MMPAPDEIMELEQKKGVHIRRLLPGNVPTFMEALPASKAEHLKDADVAIIGIPWEGFAYESAGVMVPPEAAAPPTDTSMFRTGADEAPEAIRRYSGAYSLRETGGFFPELDWDLRIEDHLRVVDYGDVEVIPGDAETSFNRAEEKLGQIVKAGAVPIVLGGDHGVTYPALSAIAQNMKGSLGIIHFDSHIDLEDDIRFHAAWQFMGAFELENISPRNMSQIGIRSLDNCMTWRANAIRLGVESHTITDVEDHGIEAIVDSAIETATDGTEAVYVTLDVDVIDPVYCPAQKYPDPAGLTSREIMKALRLIGSEKIAGFDITCLSPRYDSSNGDGAQLAARCAATVIGTIALQRMKMNQ